MCAHHQSCLWLMFSEIANIGYDIFKPTMLSTVRTALSNRCEIGTVLGNTIAKSPAILASDMSISSPSLAFNKTFYRVLEQEPESLMWISNDVSKCNGASLDNFDVPCLLYAADLVLLAETEEDLQCMFDTVLLWCRKWHKKINKKCVLYILDHRSMPKHPMNSNTGMRIYSQYRYINILG